MGGLMLKGEFVSMIAYPRSMHCKLCNPTTLRDPHTHQMPTGGHATGHFAITTQTRTALYYG